MLNSILIFFFIVFVVVVFAIIFYIISYNSLVYLRQKHKEAWSGIDVQLKKRYNLIPNLVNTVKGYAKHEQETLKQVIQARTQAIAVPNGQVANQGKAENFLTETLKSIFALSEAYPDLKASQNFLELQTEMSETEDQISAARRIYNSNVTFFNTKVQSFPSNIVANIHHFIQVEFFELDESEKESVKKVPEISF